MAAYRSSIGPQLEAFQRNVKRMTIGMLRQGLRTFRARMVRERLSGPPGVYRKSGRLKRSLKTGGGDLGVREVGKVIRMSASIGGPIAYYAEGHEKAGRLGFGRVFREEAEKTIDGIRTGFEFLAKGTGLGGGLVGFSVTGPEVEAGLEGELSDRFNPRTSLGRRRLRVAAAHLRKLAKKEQFRASGLSSQVKDRATRIERLIERGRQSQLRGRRGGR